MTCTIYILAPVIHINGYIGDLREETLYSTFKLTEDSYRNRTISDSDWAIALNNDIKNAKSVIFIGYSLGYDLELQQIFANEEGLRDKSLFVTYEPRRRALLTMQMFGEVYSDGLKEFSKEVEAIDSNYVRNEEKYEIVCLKNRKNIENVITTITAENVIGLLVDGIVQDELIYSGLEEKYVVERDCIKEAVDFISGEGRIVILHSDLANGKTLAIKQIERRLSQIGTVYFLDDISSGLADDLEYISSLEGQHYIICENYNKLLDYEEWLIIRKYQYSNIKYIFSARSYINDNFYLKLANDLDVDYKQLAMYDLNILTDHEINNFVKYLSRYNLWGRHAAKSFSDKKRFIQRKCKGEIRNLLLEVYRSQNVVSKINEILDIICRDKTCKEILLMTFVCNIMAVDISYSDIEIVLGYRINKLYFEQYNEIKELVLIEGNALRFKSSSIAAHVIAKKNFNKDILGLICKMTNVLVRHTYNAKYRNILKLMISFSNLRLIFNRDDKNISNIYVQFYENARKTQFYSNNRFFWIQYAIAVMEIKDYNAAEIYLENASSFSMERYGEDSYQVESLRARLLLEKTLYNKDIEKAFDNFEKAHNLICSNKTPEQHYPYRQASCYVEYYSTFYHYFNQEQKVAFMFMCTEMRRKMSDYLSKTNLFEKNSRKKSKEIEHILHRIETIIHKMTKEE